MNCNNLGVEFKYLVASDNDSNYGMSVNSVGLQSILPNSPYPQNNHPKGYFFNSDKGRILKEYQFIYITKGKGILSFDNKTFIPISEGRLFIIFPDQWHTYHPLTDTGWNEYFIGFKGPIFDNIVEKSFISKQNQVFDVGFDEELASLFVKAIEIAEKNKISSQQYLSGITLHILGRVLTITKNKAIEDGEAFQKIEQAKIIMNENILGNIDPEKLAEELNTSYSWFRKVFKENTGYAPAKYFQELKIRKAKQLLVSTSHTVKEISYMLDYNSAEHFFSLFKKKTGYTPLEYRCYGRLTKHNEDFSTDISLKRKVSSVNKRQQEQSYQSYI